MDVKRAADLYAQGRSLRQIGAELGVPWTAVGNQLRQAGITMRRGGPPAHPASTQQILELRDRGLTWNEIVPGAGTGKPGRPSPHGSAVGSRFSLTPLIRTLRLAFERPSPIISAEPPPGLSSPPPDEPPMV